MSTRRFFSSHPLTNNTILITDDEYHHLKHVNRARCGDPIEVIDGQGSLFSGEIQSLGKNEALVLVNKTEKCPKPPVKIIIAPSLLKQSPMNLLVEKLTEIGVEEIRPVMFTRTDETYSPSRLKKWQRIAAQSLKVNKRLWLTGIYPPVPLEKILEAAAPVKTKLLLDITGTPLGSTGEGPWQYPVIAVIGPPGDITAEERDQITKSGFYPCRINEGVLKSETAALSIASIFSFASGGSGPF